MKLLTFQNYKTVKGESHGYLTAIMYMAPAKISGREVCPYATEGCRKACLYSAGRGIFTSVQKARIARTKFFHEHQHDFLEQLHKEILAAKRKAKRMGLKLAVRLNGTSDIAWERIAPRIITDHPDVQFYDYTKNPHRFLRKLPENYSLVFSWTGENESYAQNIMNLGFNVAVVFDKLPQTFKGHRVVDGDRHDLRFLDGERVIVGLTPKGAAKKDTTGFVVRGAA